MNQRIIIGRYIAGDSWVHRLDPRGKTIAMPLFAAAVFLVGNYLDLLVVLLFTLLAMALTRISIVYYIRAVKPLIFLMLFIFLFHLIFEQSGGKVLDAGPFAIYAGGLEKAVVAAARMTLFIVFAALLTFTTPPDQMQQGLGRVLSPLKAIRLPVDRLVLMLGIALRFIPTVFDEAEQLWKAQQSRGMNFEERTLREKAKLIIALMLPVTAGAFRRALTLADSMEARGYRLGAKRSVYRTMEWQASDSLFVASFVMPIVGVLWL